MAFTAISTLSSENDSIHIFNSGDTISSSKMNSNFQLLAKQFKTNQKILPDEFPDFCSEEDMQKTKKKKHTHTHTTNKQKTKNRAHIYIYIYIYTEDSLLITLISNYAHL